VQADPRDGAAFDEWFAVLRATDLERWPDKPGWQRAERLAMALDDVGPVEHRCLVARQLDDHVVGIADLEMFRRENRHVARIDVRVLPEIRRRGVGTTIVAAAALMAIEAGRNELGGMDESPEQFGFVNAAAPFAQQLGFIEAHHMVRRELSLPLSPHSMHELWNHANTGPPDYRMLTFGDRWPDAYIDDRCLLGQRMSTDTPRGAQEMYEEVWDEARVRQIEAGLAAQNRAKITTAALHEPSNCLVAFSEVVVPLGAPESAWQHDTLVIREHRGHGLGHTMKAINIAAVMDAHPDVCSISTWNAADNVHMMVVNDMLGFSVVAHAVYWLKKLRQ
jgi:GNAT superfamily N-acetyltransferase